MSPHRSVKPTTILRPWSVLSLQPGLIITKAFYDQVFRDPLLSPFFTDNDAHHAERLALYLTQRFSDAQRDRWIELMMNSLKDHRVSSALHAELKEYFFQTALLAQQDSFEGVDRFRRM